MTKQEALQHLKYVQEYIIEQQQKDIENYFYLLIENDLNLLCGYIQSIKE